jgi:ATP-dependent exoDNAse (exonuclease V) alpha subunit
MKKLILFLAVTLFAVGGCKEKKQADYTILGFYTPYSGYMERLNGKVETVTETNYWAVPEGETFVKGKKMTSKELDSLNYTGDFTARFDEAGDLVSCTWYDENKKMLAKWEITKENNMMNRAEYTSDDTLRYYHKLKCDSEGDIIESEVYNAAADTLMWKGIAEKSVNGDTVTYKYFDNKGELNRKVLDIYNDKGLFQGYQSYDKDGNYLGSDELIYDENGKGTGIKFFDKDKNTTAANIFINEYDAKGNWIKTICKDEKGFTIIGERVYTYFE